MRLRAYGQEGKSYRAQQRCTECFAWLPVLPNRGEEWKGTYLDRDPGCPICGDMDEPANARPHDCLIEHTSHGWTLHWECVRCGNVATDSSSSGPESWGLDPEAEYEEAGKVDQHLSRDPEDWPESATMTEEEKAVIRAAASHVWVMRREKKRHWKATALVQALDSQSVEETLEAVERYVVDESAIPQAGRVGVGSSDALRVAYGALNRPTPERLNSREEWFIFRLARAESVCRACLAFIEKRPADFSWELALWYWKQYVDNSLHPESKKAPFGGEREAILSKRLRLAEEVWAMCDLNRGADTEGEYHDDWEEIKALLKQWKRLAELERNGG